jgi:hypothetical protein
MTARLERAEGGYRAADGRFTVQLVESIGTPKGHGRMWRVEDTNGTGEDAVTMVDVLSEVREWISGKLAGSLGENNRPIPKVGRIVKPEPQPTFAEVQAEHERVIDERVAAEEAGQVPPHVLSGQQTVARVMKARWKTAWRVKDEAAEPSDRMINEEQTRWDELIDYIEAHGLNGTGVDPR